MDFFTTLVFGNLYFIGILKFISDIAKLDNRFSNFFEKFSNNFIFFITCILFVEYK